MDLTKILKYCPKGTKLYSTVLGEVSFKQIINGAVFPIIVDCNEELSESFTADGRLLDYDGECTLFPSREMRDWTKFTAPWYNNGKKVRFDPKTLKPFDKIIARVDEHGIWCCEWFSFIDSFIEENIILIKGCGAYYKYCIPYNDDTKHLVGTKDEAPEFYKYWEE